MMIDVKEGWEVKKLGEICEFGNGLWTGKKPPFQKVGVIRNTNFTKDGKLDDTDIVYLEVEKSQFLKRKLKYGDIILEKSGGGPKQPVGRVIIFDKEQGDFSFSNFTSIIRIINSEKVDFSYLHRFLFFSYISGATEKMQSHSTGIRNLKFDDYKDIYIPIPPLPEQQRIVSILDEAFAAIAQAKANAEQNLKNTKELFESYLQGFFQDGILNSTVGDQILLQRGFDITKTQQEGEGTIPVVSSGGIKSFHNKSMVEGPGVVIGRKGTLGKVFYLETAYWPHDTTLWVKDFKGNNPRFVYYFLKGLDVKSLDSGAANPALNRNQVHPIKVRWSPILEQPTIVQKLDLLSAKTKKLESIYQKKIADLEELKKSLLEKAFKGELVLEAESI